MLDPIKLVGEGNQEFIGTRPRVVMALQHLENAGSINGRDPHRYVPVCFFPVKEGAQVVLGADGVDS